MKISFALFAGIASLSVPALAQIPNTLLNYIPAPAGGGLQSGARLGSSVVTEGAYTVAGAPYDDVLGKDCGAVKVFDSVSGALLFVLPNPNPDKEELFGSAVALSGTRLVVGVSEDGTGGTRAGIAYVYDLSSATPTVPILTLNNPAASANDYFGYSVGISGTRMVVGAYRETGGAGSSGVAYVYDLASGTPVVPVATLTHPGAAPLDSFGISVAISGAQVVVGANRADTGATDAGRAFVFDLTSGTPTVPVAILDNPSPAASDGFGRSVAISGTRAVVGASMDDAGATNAGSAYVYDLTNGTPTVPVVSLNNPSPASNDLFGFAVAISGTRLAVGTYEDDTAASGAGLVYVYELTSGTPSTPVLTLNNPTPMAADYFGCAVALSGPRMVVGAYGDGTAASSAGSAYVYDLAGGTPGVPILTLNHTGPASADLFGGSVALSGSRLAVGVPADDTVAFDSGCVYVYDLTSATPAVPLIKVSNPSPAASDGFGQTVAIDGATLVVGSPGDDTGTTNAGSVYVYDLDGATPTVPSLTLNNPLLPVAFNDEFGYSVAISGSRIVVGIYDVYTANFGSGGVAVYNLSSGTPTVPILLLTNPGPTLSDRFGRSVAISGTRVVVGTPQDETGAVDAGRVYVYDVSSATPTLPTAILNNPSPFDNDYFGDAVAISGTRVVVGAYNKTTAGLASGGAYVFDLSSGTPTVPVVTLSNPSPTFGDFFGDSVAISGTRVLVGAPNDSTGASQAGSVYVYDINSGTPSTPVATLNNPSPAFRDYFGWAVAIDGTNVAVGTPEEDSVLWDNGAVYTYGPHPLDQDSDGLRDAWELIYWPGTAGHNPLDDSDHDGICELLEQAFSLNPTLPSAGGLLAPVNESGYLTMTIAKQPGVSYEVQTAGTLLPALPNSFSAASTTVLTNNGTTLKVRDNFLIGTSPPRFMRVKVTAAP